VKRLPSSDQWGRNGKKGNTVGGQGLSEETVAKVGGDGDKGRTEGEDKEVPHNGAIFLGESRLGKRVETSCRGGRRNKAGKGVEVFKRNRGKRALPGWGRDEETYPLGGGGCRELF